MNLKKFSLKVVVFMLLVMSLGLFQETKAVMDLTTNPISFGIRNIRSSGMGYSIKNPKDNATSGMAANIWEIIQYDSDTGIKDVNAYCIKAGVGFSDTTQKVEYNIAFDMKTEKDELLDLNNDMITNLVNGGYYNHLLAIGDLLYLPGVSTPSQREKLLRDAGCDNLNGNDVEYLITDDEVEAIQQAAIWYFTNYGEENGKYDLKEAAESWFTYTTDENTYDALMNYNKNTTGEGQIRALQAIKLYNYLIDTATENSEAYANGTAKSKTTLTLYTARNNLAATQPIMLLERDPGEFDLALRKYITKVTTNGTTVELTDTLSREPVIAETTLTGEEGKTTAIYKHKKDPVEVETGSVVTYKLTIYNEGEIAGRALKVVDVLPEGLQFTRVVSGNFELESNTNNVVTLKRKDGSDTNLLPYEVGKLSEYSETIELECTVTEIADKAGDKILTNVAYISDAADETGKQGTTLVDRDSQPATVPNTTDLPNYKGTTTEIDLSKQDTYYPGQQDDDDFEKLVIKKLIEKPFDLKLLKRITAVNGTPVTERLVSVDISKLASGDETTATYKMTKDPVEVQKGDIVTYTFRIYNEGEVDGYASEITENIPEGLEFIWSDKIGDELEADTTFTAKEKEAIEFNQNNLWVASSDLQTISTDYLAKEQETYKGSTSLIKAFDKNSAYSNTETAKNPDYQEVSVMLKVVAENVTKGIIRNEAAITQHTNSEGNAVTDRDSTNTQDGWKKENGNKYYDNTTNWSVYEEDDEDYDNIILKEFDLALRKFITKIGNKNITTRLPEPQYNSDNEIVEYEHDKTPLLVKQGDIVTYTIRIYNEGDIAGYASKITDDIPAGLKFLPNNETNKEMRWKMIDSEGRETTDVSKAIKIVTDYLSKEKGEEGGLAQVIDPETGLNINPNLLHSYKKDKNPEYKDVQVVFEVVEPNTSDNIIINSAQISDDTNAKGDQIDDKDSITDKWNNGEDDQDQEFIKLQYFDLALRKFITKIDDKNITTRVPEIKYDSANNQITYEHDKTPLEVMQGDIVIYTIRVYNEGDIAGYASEITDDMPEGLEFLPNNEINKNMRWKMIDAEGKETTDVSKAKKVTTDYLSKEQNEDKLLKAFDKEAGITDTNPDYEDLQIAFKVIEPGTSERVIINSAQISDDTDAEGDPVDDKDSTPDEWKDGEDDQDQEFIRLKYFDLALRKFITSIGDEDVTTRVPSVEYDEKNNKLSYEHTKDPMNVVTGDIVTYTIRVYNEGTIAGYAQEVTDDIPAGLEFLPNNSLNKEMRWKMVDSEGKETTDVSKAVKITTNYLSKEQDQYNLLKAFDKEEDISEENPEYKDVKVAFKVVEPNTSNNIIINSAQISEDSDSNGDPVDDIDSIPDKWNDGEDDQDKEYIKLDYFDLALRKWVTQAIVIENGKETITQTGHTPEMNPEPVVKVDLHRKKINDVTVKFRYSIRITNEGDIAGYAKEITDYVPEGLKFVAADNKGWTDEGNNVISTKLLENTLLQPGESADVEVVLTWINGQDNMGQKTNIAEISEDYNDKDVPDKDSTPDNKKDGEDDIDDAPVLLSIQTGQARIYYSLILIILVTMAGGIILIKKFVL